MFARSICFFLPFLSSIFFLARNKLPLRFVARRRRLIAALSGKINGFATKGQIVTLLITLE